MCRRCGEPDQRGSVHNRRARRAWLISPESLFGGDGEKVECWNYRECGQILDRDTLTVDRIVPGWQCAACYAATLTVVAACQHDDAASGHPFKGGSYRRNNIRPSCLGCNQGRNKGNPWGLRIDPAEARCMTR